MKAVAQDLSDSARWALENALVKGEETRQREGKKRLTRQDCVIRSGYQSPNHPSTVRSIVRRGLAEGFRYSNKTLTADGMAVARAIFAEGHEESLADHVATYLAERKRIAEEHEAKVERAAILWRDLDLADDRWLSDNYGTETTAVSDAIRREFSRGSGWRDSLVLDLDDLIAIGEKIEEMRV